MNILVNGAKHDVPEGTTIAQLLLRLDVPARAVAVEVNLEVIPRGRHAEHLLREGDRLEVVSLVGGG